MADLIRIAVITSAHGIRGQVKLKSLADPTEAVFNYTLTDRAGNPIRLTRQGGGATNLIASIEGITDRNAAEALKNTELFTQLSALPAPDDNQFYPAQLIGLEARLKTGAPYGRVTGLHNYGAGDIIELELATGGSEMLPFREPFIGDIHAEQGWLAVTPPNYSEAK